MPTITKVSMWEYNWEYAAYLAVRKSMKEPACLYKLNGLLDHISISTSRSGGHDILVKWKRNEHCNYEKIDHSANSSHCLWYLFLVDFAHILPFQSCFHESRSEPSYHGVRASEGYSAERQRCDERCAIALEGIRDDGETCERE